MASSGMKIYFISKTSCFSNLYLIECFRKCKSKSYLKAILMIVQKGLTMTRKKLNCLKMKMCRGVHLRRVKIKDFAHKWTHVCGTLIVVAEDTRLQIALSLRFLSLRKVEMSLPMIRANHK